METEIARFALGWDSMAMPDVWRPARADGLDDRETLLARIRAGLQAEPDLVKARRRRGRSRSTGTEEYWDRIVFHMEFQAEGFVILPPEAAPSSQYPRMTFQPRAVAASIVPR